MSGFVSKLRPGSVRAAVLVLAAFAAGLLSVSVAAHFTAAPDPSDPAALAKLQAQFRRPDLVPVPADNIPSPQRIALGARLFNEVRLSANDKIACSNCHDPALSFTDGVARGKGIAKVPLPRHTPSLWNVAWARALFWDGRANSLEAQAYGPIENPKEMGQPLARGAEKIAADPGYAKDFAKAFPDDPGITPDHIVKALASFERTFVSPRTRFDRWVEGDATALSEAEIRGFKLFTGKAQCSNCHSGWAFTDYGFHDIGLPGADLGRGPVIGLPEVNHAFKTPSLRELVWTAPYMHDGSLATLDDVISHYESGGVKRPTRSPDFPKNLSLSPEERSDLIAFLESLSSEQPPKPATDIHLSNGKSLEPAPPVVATSTVSQENKTFVPGRIEIAKGETLTVLNEDTRPHNVRVFDPRMKFNSGIQEPGERIAIPFKQAGSFEIFCGIHPNMRLTVEVR